MSAQVVWLGLLLGLGTRCDIAGDDTAPEPTPSDGLGVGLRHFDAQATIADDHSSYEGWEAFHFTGDRGLGDDVCQVRYTMTSTDTRADCPDCLWAFDLISADAQIEGESGKGCAGLGITTAEFDGVVYSYGFAEASGGYQQVLMYRVGSYGWYPVCGATWAEPGFQYDWEMELYYY